MVRSLPLNNMLTAAKLAAGPKNILVSGLSYDSRRVNPGDLFFAVKGVHTDGHQFLDEVGGKGAVAAIVGRKTSSPLPQFVATDMPESMALMADLFYDHPSTKIPVIGITGTNGKTTGTYIMENILRVADHTCGVIGTINYRWGKDLVPAPNTTPMSPDVHRFLADSIERKCAAVIMEVSSHALEQNRVKKVKFSVGIFTNLTQDHLDFHKNMEAYFQAKARLFRESPGIKKVFNIEDPYGKRLKEEFKEAITYGFEAGASLRASAEISSLEGLRFNLTLPSKKTVSIVSNLMGHHNISNLMASAGAMLAFGLDEDTVVRGLNTPHHVPGRFERIDCGQDFVVLVDYAHTEDALLKALQTLRTLKPRRLISLFGAGGDRDRTKRPKMGKVASELSDFVVVTSDNPRSEDPLAIMKDIEEGIKPTGFKNYEMKVDREQAIEDAVGLAGPNDIVLIAGKGHENYQIYKDRRIHFSDVEEAKKSLTKKMGR